MEGGRGGRGGEEMGRYEGPRSSVGHNWTERFGGREGGSFPVLLKYIPLRTTRYYMGELWAPKTLIDGWMRCELRKSTYHYYLR